MMDEALYVYKKTARAVDLVATVAWDTENFERVVSEAIANQCNRMPVVVVNDMVEQHYRKERVLTSGVSFFDRNSMVQRKLNMAFPNYPVRAALPLKEKIKGEGGKMSSDVFIFAAIPNTQQLVKTIEAVNLSLASCSGLVLLPVESSTLVNSISKSLRKKNDAAARWVVMIGQHKNGSLRQVVTKSGEIALTRMSPISDTDEDPKRWANEVLQEFRATMSYLTRFGFQPEDGLDIILVGRPEAGEIVGQYMDNRFNYQCLSPEQAAKLVGLSLGKTGTQHYADPLHIGWLAKKNSYVLPMRSKLLDNVARPRQLANFGAIALVLAVAFMGYQLMSTVSTSLEISDEIQTQRNTYQNLDTEYQVELKKKEELGFDVRLIQSSMNIFAEYQKNNIRPLELIKAVGEALGNDMRIDKLSITSSKEDAVNQSSSVRASIPSLTPKPLFEATFQITYPSSADVIKGNQEIVQLRDRVHALLPDYEVEVTKLLKDYKYVEEITVETGTLPSVEEVAQDFVAEIMIKGPAVQ
jgi:hypothetical protein